ncbi:MAG: SGNH/GDSL hydrolase family protein [Oscillospiraceae bacterium]|nr:SGNH/GDSL hydrolase family protein [Oscillospiraceae bacterium]
MERRLTALVCMLLVTTVLAACLGAYLKFEILLPAGLFQDKSLIETPFAVLEDPAACFVLRNLKERKPDAEPTQPPTEPVVETSAPVEAAPTLPPLIAVTEHWFDDVLFIGDSRTVGLRDYARLGDADYFCSVGLSVFKVLDESLSDVNFSKMQLEQLLREKKYNKIYISLGLNDCGAPYDLLMEAYSGLLHTVQDLQPHAVIILQSMITLSREKAASEWYFSLENLQIVNAGIRDFANGRTILYIDANEYYADEEGYLPSWRSFDGCHFDIEGYREWAQWILENAKTLNISFG